MKTCTKCGVAKTFSDFYANPSTRDKLHPYCKDCLKSVCKQARFDKGVAARRSRERLAYIANREHYRNKRDLWGKRTAYQYVRDKQKLSAKSAVSYAIKAGKLVKGLCVVCGDTNVQAHHTDYSKKLDVVWLCPPHHGITWRKEEAS